MSSEAQIRRQLPPIIAGLGVKATPETFDLIFSSLCDAHPVYKRAPQAVLKRTVTKALQGLRGAEEAPASASEVAAPPQARVSSLNDSLYGGGGGGVGGGGGEGGEGTVAALAAAAAADGPSPPAPAARKKRGRDGSAVAAAAEGGKPQEEWRLPSFVRPRERLAHVGGMDCVLRVLREAIEFPLRHPEVYHHLRVEPPRGVLLHGPPGCGKTLLARALAGELGVHFRAVTGPELVGGLSGESESRLRAVFQDAEDNAPSLLFIDELDVLAPKLEAGARGMERRMVSQLLTCIDGLAAQSAGADGAPRAGKPVMLLAATSKPDSLDPALRRTGRFDKEVPLPIPDEGAREAILGVLTRNCNVGPPSAARPDLRALARVTPGYVGADLAALVKEAAVGAIERALRSGGSGERDGGGGGGGGSGEDMGDSASGSVLAPPLSLEHLFLLHGDFEAAVARVQPSATREGFAMVPNVSWDDVGALSAVRDELGMAILQPLRRPEAFRALGLSVPAGVLLYGPPGCGKTLLAKAIAAESAANFISVKGPELLDKYVGESERAVRALFTRARASAPCIVFFDEMDALAPRRGGGGSGGGGASEGTSVTERVVNQLLTEMDGLEARRDVFVIAATNRPDIIDPAMLRPGRLDKLLFVPLPTASDRAAILRTQARRTPLDPDVDFDALAAHPRAARFSGADLAALIREAAVGVLKEFFEREGSGGGGGAAAAPRPPAMRDFLAAFEKVHASVSPSDERMYDALRQRLRGGSAE
jgi:ribosome biogenesis ATPase